MITLKEIKQSTHQRVSYYHNSDTNLEAIIAIHSTALGPSLGGCRMMPYSTKEEALRDVLRLSEGMTYKAAIAGLKLGGGKAVILSDPKLDKTTNLLKSFGEFINELGGDYITAEDMGMTVRDMEIIKTKTKHVTGLSESLGGSGDPSDFTSYGTYVGIKTAANFRFGNDDLNGLSIAVQGLGNVGLKLIKYLSKYDIKIFVNDVDLEKINQCVSDYRATPVSSEELYDLDVDIFCPCAIGGIINDSTIKKMKFKIIAGAANNILEDYNKHGKMLFQKGVLYAPDYVINAGGLINIYNEFKDIYNRDDIFNQVSRIGDTLTNIFEISNRDSIATNIVSDKLATDIIKKAEKDKASRIKQTESCE